jgi:hypothetical protein
VPWRLDGESLFGPRSRERFVLVGDRGTFTADPRALVARRTESLARQVALFGSGREPPGLYGLGPYRALLGEPVSSLSVTVGGDARAELDQADELRAVDLGAEEVPARLTGTISGDGAVGRALAVALGGRVVAVARSYAFAGEERFSVLVPESALTEGANDVEVFWVRPGLELAPLLAGRT